MTLMVTGGAGFIGSHIVDALLARGHRVDVIDDLSTGSTANLQKALGHPRFAFHEVDLCSQMAARIVEKVKPTFLMHLAAQATVGASIQDPWHDARVNVLGLVNVLEAAVAANVKKVIFASSGGTIYGDHPPRVLPIPESSPRSPNSYYGLSKLVGCEYLRLYRDLRGIDYVALALGNVYGPRQDPNGGAGVVNMFVNRMSRGEPGIIYGSGENTRDFVYVADVVEAFVAAMSAGSGTINIGTGVESSVLDVHDAVARYFPGHTSPVHMAAQPGEVSRIALDISCAREQLGWSPRVALREGVRRYLLEEGLIS